MDIDEELNNLLQDPLFEPTKKEKQLFELTDTMLKTTKDKQQADFVAQRRPCDTFDEEFAAGFKAVQQDLKTGRRKLKRYSVTALQAGHYYVISGVLIYLAEIYETTTDISSHFAKDGRTRTIYENGTESNVMLQTLSRGAYMDGYVVSEPDTEAEATLFANMGITPEDKQDGWIYVLSSLSKNPEIASVSNLYKIGFSTVPVEERIKNCEKEPTYLMDKVKIIATWKTFNMKTEVLETLIHQFFKSVQFQIRVKDAEGNIYDPQEWFVVPLEIISKAVECIIDGSIIKYKYNPTLQLIEEVPGKDRIQAGEFDKTGWKILTLNIKKEYFKEILSGEKTIEYRQLKESNLNKFTWVDGSDGKRYMKKFDALRLKVSGAIRESAIVEIMDTQYDLDQHLIEYHLGKVLSVDTEKGV